MRSKDINTIIRTALSVLLILTSSILIAQRGQVSRDEWDEGDGGDSSWAGYLITLAIIFGIPWLISKYLKSKENKKND
ncbi:MAG: hypothetical protein RQ875_05505 [Vicingaceae bacterium]|nr:hypothetical protein [Vicingaceae bacterium]